MFGLNLWAAPLLHASNQRPVSFESKDAASFAGFSPAHGLMMLTPQPGTARGTSSSTRSISNYPFSKETADATPFTAGHSRLDPHFSGFQYPYFSSFYPHFYKSELDPRTAGHSEFYLHPSFGHPAFPAAKQLQIPKVSGNYRSELSREDNVGLARSPVSRKSSPAVRKVHLYSPVSSPAERRKVTPTYEVRKGATPEEDFCDNSRCPVCREELQPHEYENHLASELHKLDSFLSDLKQNDSSSSQLSETTLKFSSRYYDSSEFNQQASQSRYQTYLRIKHNRQNRLQAKSSRYFHKHHGGDGDLHYSGISSMSTPGHLMDRKHQEDIKPHLVYEESNMETSNEKQKSKPNNPLFHDSTDEVRFPGEEKNSSLSEIPKREENLGSRASSSKAVPEVEAECYCCKSAYVHPVTSVQCWHVLCESCWLTILNTEGACPKCHLTTCPRDLRRISI